MIDTHTHLYLPDFKDNISEIILNCISNKIHHLVLPNIDFESLYQMKELHEQYPDMTSMAIGLHPTEVEEDWLKFMDILEVELQTGKYKAVGEIGMDLYWDKTFAEQQKNAFEYQIKIAEKYNLPIIIHCRSALQETLEIIKKIKPSINMIFHSFTGSKEDVKAIRKICDPYFGINGVITYKNANDLREALPEIGIERIVLETDSPYLTPVPYRGKQNNSSYLIHIKDKVAETLQIPSEEAEQITDKTAEAIFNL